MARLAVALLAILATACLWGSAAGTCQAIARVFAPCMGYLVDRAWTPYGPCCGAVVALNRTSTTWVDKVNVCNCLKEVAIRLPHVDPARATLLPHICGVHLNITISPFLDCNTIPNP